MAAATASFTVAASFTDRHPCSVYRVESAESLETLWDAWKRLKIANDFRMPYSEVGKIRVDESIHFDYLSQRVFALAQMRLKASGRR